MNKYEETEVAEIQRMKDSAADDYETKPEGDDTPTIIDNEYSCYDNLHGSSWQQEWIFN